MTREEKNAYQKQWRLKNKDKLKEINKRYRESHKEQAKEIHKKWRENNREYINKKAREKYKKNPLMYKNIHNKYRKTHIEQEKERHHNYKINNRDKCSAYERKRREEPLYRLRTNIRVLIKGSFKRKSHKANTKTEQILGCSIEDFISYIQRLFKDGMTLENHGLWHLDHIIPISSAKTEEEIIKLNHYTNFQPLWAEENLKKSNKII